MTEYFNIAYLFFLYISMSQNETSNKTKLHLSRDWLIARGKSGAITRHVKKCSTKKKWHFSSHISKHFFSRASQNVLKYDLEKYWNWLIPDTPVWDTVLKSASLSIRTIIVSRTAPTISQVVARDAMAVGELHRLLESGDAGLSVAETPSQMWSTTFFFSAWHSCSCGCQQSCAD